MTLFLGLSSCSFSGLNSAVSSTNSTSSSYLSVEESPSVSSSSCSTISIDDVDTYVYQAYDLSSFTSDINETYSYEFTGNDIYFEGDEVYGLKADTTTDVTLLTSSGRKGEFQVKVLNRPYTSKHSSTESSEGWFTSVDVDPISGLSSKENFINGMDISSCKYLYDLGAKFYNDDGVEESLFFILKEHNVNWVRIRLWNDPSDDDFMYGGGNCNLENVIWMAKEATRAGLKYLLDFHYSDFWADPSYQVVPKAWSSYTHPSQMASSLYYYTYDVLTELKNDNALPSMVQIGNEITKGLCTDCPTSEKQTTATGDNPSYIKNSSKCSSTIGGYYTKGGANTNLINYISKGIQAVRDVDSSIPIMLHLAKGLSDTSYIIDFFNTFKNLDYDVIGLSAYSYYQFSSINVLKSSLATISEAFPKKKICIAETSYGYTYETDSNANNSFSSSSSTCHPISGYPCSVQGQADMVRDTIASIASISNGIGSFYWEGAWVPIRGGGWSDSSSKDSWANQGFFSYNGKALSSLSLYEKIYQ